MYSIKDYQDQVEIVKEDCKELKAIVDEFLERWKDIADNIDNLKDSIEELPF